MMKKRMTAAGLAVAAAVLAGAGFLIFTLQSRKTEIEYVTAGIVKGDIRETVSSSGRLKAVGTVDVLTQLTGTVEKIHADFNDKIKKGMPLAELDTSMLKIALKDAEAALSKAKAQYEHDRFIHENNVKLAQRNLISESDLLAGRKDLEISRAGLTQAELQHERARLNIDEYAVILSPIDGLVLARGVEEGQTVVANSGSVTKLFTLAANLDAMEIEAEVDELDIGRIRQGQTVKFDVEAHPDRLFEGSVRQIRMVPVESDNVVNYTVIVSAKNEVGLLLPGMTANMEFIVREKKGVLTAPNAAFRFTPPGGAAGKTGAAAGPERKTALLGGMPRFPGGPGGGSGRTQNASGAARGGNGASRGEAKTEKILWLMKDDGTLRAVSVATGLSSGTVTEILDAPELEGAAVVVRTK